MTDSVCVCVCVWYFAAMFMNINESLTILNADFCHFAFLDSPLSSARTINIYLAIQITHQIQKMSHYI